MGVVPVRGGPGTNDPGRVTFSQVPLDFVIMQAWDISPDRIKGPGWIADPYGPKYTIVATMPLDTTQEQFRVMLQNLLAERFGLKLHREVQSLPGFELSTAPGGSKLSEWTPEPIPDGPVPHYSEDSLGFPMMATGHTGCTGGGGWAGAKMPLKFTCRASMDVFTRFLGQYIKMANDSPRAEVKPEVIDKTGLRGVYEFRFVFEGTVGGGLPASSTPPDPSGGASARSLFDALQRQLGLRLVKVGNVSTTFLIVDSAQKVPTEN
jgi:uncharacterized protein (TIGR03435 family)